MMIELVRQRILEPSQLGFSELERLLSQIHHQKIDYADLYFQSIESSSLSLEDGIVKEADFHLDQGVGIRAISGTQTGFSYSNDLSIPSLQEAVNVARQVGRGQDSFQVNLKRNSEALRLYSDQHPLGALKHPDLVQLLHDMDELARQSDPRVKQVMASLTVTHEWILVAASDGTLAADIRPLVHTSLRVIVESQGKREIGFAGGGGRYSVDRLLQKEVWTSYVHEAVRSACLNLEAVEAPAGTMSVVLGKGWPGVLLHEAVGHGLEGDFNRKGSSAFSRKMGEMVASPLCTVVDDGTLEERRGSLSMDDEGTPTQKTVLIENGRLVGYMQDKLNARLMNTRSTGNARRESYAHLPMPRMTNTYMQAGEHDPEDMIRSIDKGLYAVNFNGGQVDITSGKYVFVTSEAYLIEKGKITRPVKGATLIGDGPTSLHNIRMVGHDLALDPGIGVCGKEGQSVPVGVGMPTILIDKLTVGGSAS